MDTLVAWAAAVVLWTAVVTRAVTKHRELNRYDTLMAAFAIGATIDVGTASGTTVGPSPLAHAVLAVSSLVGLLIGVEILRKVAAGGTTPRHVWRWRLVTGVAALALAVTTAIGQPTGPLADPSWARPVAMTCFWAGYGCYQLTASVVMLVFLGRFLGRLAPGPMRQTSLLIGAALVLSAAFAVSLLVLAASAWIPGSDVVARIGAAGYRYGSVAYALLGLAYLRMRVARSGRRGADTRTLRALTPLWRSLQADGPDLTLGGLPGDPDRLRRDGLAMACVRAAVEIRDWMHVLARRLPPDAYAEAEEAAGRMGGPGDQRALATAGWLRAGLGQPATARHTPHSPAPPAGADLDQDLELLVATAHVADAAADAVAAEIVAGSIGNLPARRAA